MKYRADIDGLRAISVLSVVLFHLDLPGFQGGYVGVDVFFVISGYLITSIIKYKYENDDFKLSDFYARRIRRLVPPLIATIAATLLGAAIIMTPYDMVALSRSAAAALVSLSNISFYLEAGYWDTASELKPLLHTWSLGVEEQFYLFWPAITIGLLSIRRYIAFGMALAMISLLGALLCIWFTTIDQSAAFYLLPFRVFQFSVGALLIPLTPIIQNCIKKHSYSIPNIAFSAGLLCIAISVTTLSGDTVFPGYAVLLPTIGAFLVLLGGTCPNQLPAAAHVLMKNPISLWLGRASYSMYLVHWPLIALFRYLYGSELTVADQFILGAGTLSATCVLHYGVERRFYQRDSGTTSRPTPLKDSSFALRTLVVAGVLALLATSAWKGDGWAWRFPPLLLSAEQIKQGKADRFRKVVHTCNLDNVPANKNCHFEKKLQMLVLGNSLEVDGYNFISAGFGDDENLNLIRFGGTEGQCINFRKEYGRIVTDDEQCQVRLDALFDSTMVARLNLVFYAADSPYAANKQFFLAILQQLKLMNPGVNIVTLGGYIITKRPCAYYISETNTTDACALPENVSYFADTPKDQPLFEQFRAIESHYIDRVDLLCKNRVIQTCRTRTDDGVPALYDRRHSSLEFSEMSGKMYSEMYPELLHELTYP